MKKLFLGLIFVSLLLLPGQDVFCLSNTWPDDDGRVDGSVDTMDEVDDFINTLSLDVHERLLSTDGETVQIQTNWTAAGKTCADLGTVTTGVYSTVDINAGAIDGITLGTNSAVTSAVFTTADTNGGTLDGVQIGNETATGMLFVNDASDDADGLGDQGTSGEFLQSAGAGANPVFSKVDLADTNDVTGTLAIANGGTGATTDDVTIKGWVNFQGSSTINDSYNVDSITDNGTGDYTITWTTDFGSSSYAVAGMALYDATPFGHVLSIKAIATGTLRVILTQAGGGHNAVDANPVTVLAIGNQ